MSTTTVSIPNHGTQTKPATKIHILQHNCARSTNVMQSCLNSAINTADIILFQEPWIGRDNITTVSHPVFTCLIPATSNDCRPRVAAFIFKTKVQLVCTPRPDITMDLDIQALSILAPGLKDTLLLNIYNEKNLQSDLQQNL